MVGRRVLYTLHVQIKKYHNFFLTFSVKKGYSLWQVLIAVCELILLSVTPPGRIPLPSCVVSWAGSKQSLSSSYTDSNNIGLLAAAAQKRDRWKSSVVGFQMALIFICVTNDNNQAAAEMLLHSIHYRLGIRKILQLSCPFTALQWLGVGTCPLL